MLVLTRKAGEQICIGDDIVVTVRRLNGNRASIAIDAPSEVRIRRSELPPISQEYSNGQGPPKVPGAWLPGPPPRRTLVLQAALVPAAQE